MGIADMLGRPRATLILLHPTSLPDPPRKAYGIGELGSEAFRFIDFLFDSGTLVWQTLPFGHVDDKEFSPYQTYSRFSGSPYVISIEQLLRERDLSRMQHDDYMDRARSSSGAACPANPQWLYRNKVGRNWKDDSAILRKAFHTFAHKSTKDKRRKAFEDFRERESSWLKAYADYMALREHHNHTPWSEWPNEFRDINHWMEQRETVLQRHADLAQTVAFYEYLQFVFFEQWDALRAYAHSRGRKLMGDLPWYVGYDSADVWARPDVFDLDEQGRPRHVAGVPPDYFSPTGQLWGNPVYNWDNPAARQWWVDAVEFNLRKTDILRMDHFRAIDSYWKIPYQWATEKKNARGGMWAKAPGRTLLEELRDRLKSNAEYVSLENLPIVAEDLGFLDPLYADVKEYPDKTIPDKRHRVDPALRRLIRHKDARLSKALNKRTGEYSTRRAVDVIMRDFELSWMAVLQFGFEGDPRHHPDKLPQDALVYTGTHDNDTALGWYTGMVACENRARSFGKDASVPGAAIFDRYLSTFKQCIRTGEYHSISLGMIEAAMRSQAGLAGLPIQDLLRLGSEGRMNVPGDATHTWWTWRAIREQMDYDLLAEELGKLNKCYKRYA